MTIEHFIQELQLEVFTDTDPSLVLAQTKFKDLDEWDSLIALSVIVLVDQQFSVSINGDDIKNTESIEDLYILINSKK